MDLKDAELLAAHAEALDELFDQAEGARIEQDGNGTCPKCGGRKLTTDTICSQCKLFAGWRDKDARNFRGRRRRHR